MLVSDRQAIVSDIFPQRAISSVAGICGFGGATGGMLVSSAVGCVLQDHRQPLTIFTPVEHMIGAAEDW